ncbi:hypothetical protein DENSPDRAFT_841225 [Dentipellis sp. KUC8613]|nr:hypothetical protein DENSPDRAFT_841225 [Dentipellis sp. KUC8613]
MASAYLSIFTRQTQLSCRTGLSLRANAASRTCSYSARSQLHNHARPQLALRRQPTSFTLKAAGLTTVGLGLSTLITPIFCEPPKTAAAATPAQKPAPIDPASEQLPPPPESIVNLYELGFGTVCGICAGVFVKKGAKAVAFALGGVFVLLQYLASLSLLKVDWNRAGQRFARAFHGPDGRPPRVSALWRALVDFLTADFQPRASFVAGFVLGLRVG